MYTKYASHTQAMSLSSFKGGRNFLARVARIYTNSSPLFAKERMIATLIALTIYKIIVIAIAIKKTVIAYSPAHQPSTVTRSRSYSIQLTGAHPTGRPGDREADRVVHLARRKMRHCLEG